MATNVNLYDVGIRPKFIKEKKKNLLIKFKTFFPELDINKIKKKIK